MKKFEFSKFIAIFAILICTGIAVWSIIQYYILIQFAIESGSSYIMPDASLPIAAMSTILGTILSYCLYQGFLKNSLNKNGLTINQTTGEIIAIQHNLEQIVTDLTSDDLVEDFIEQKPVDCDYPEG